MGSASRITYIDLLKCLAIFMVVLGHSAYLFEDVSLSRYINWDYITPIHMPLFAALSGFLFSTRDSTKEFIIKKGRQLILPLLFWGAIKWVFPRLVHDFYFHLEFGSPIYFKPILRNFLCYGVLEGLWFLKALFFCFSWFYMSLLICKGRCFLTVIFSCLVVYSASFGGVIPNKSSLFEGFVFLYPFFCTGVIIKEIDRWIEEKMLFVVFLSGISFFVLWLFLWNGKASAFYDMNTSIFENNSVFGVIGKDVVIATFNRFLIGASGSLFWISLFRLLFENLTTNKVIDVLSSYGMTSLAIYILHLLLIDNLGSFPIFVNKYAAFVCSFFISILLMIICYYLYRLSTFLPSFMQLLMWGKQMNENK